MNNATTPPNRTVRSRVVATLNRFLDRVITHVIALLGFVFFYVFCRGYIINKTTLDKVVADNNRFIIAMNHVSYLDWIVVWAIFRYRYQRRIIFLAKDKLFRHPIWGALMRHAQCVRVSDDGRSILNNADKARLGDHIIGIFPEGKRSRDGHLQELRSGVAVLAKKHNLPILPLGLNGFYEAWQPNAKYPSPHPMHVVVGDLIDSYGNIRQMLDTVQDQLSLVSTSTLDISNVTSAFIDVDKTLTDTSIADLLFYVKKRTLSPVRYRLWYLKVAMLAPVLRLLDKVYRPLVQVIVYQMYAGIPQSTLKQHARDYYSSTMRSKVYPETAAIIDQLTKQGAAITLVSTNLDVTLGNLASDYEVELRAIDLRYLQCLPLLKKLKYLSQFKDTVMQQEATPSSLAIGDSKYDKPLFEKCTWSILKASSSIDRRLAGLVHQVM